MMLLKLSPVLLMVACYPGIGPVTPQNHVERKMIGLLEKFDRWDEDGSGTLDQRELAPSQKESVLIIAFYDSNKDQKISLPEAQAGFARSDEAKKMVDARR